MFGEVLRAMDNGSNAKANDKGLKGQPWLPWLGTSMQVKIYFICNDCGFG